jgi:glycosyltransferase involved in cell wall biosynthesis
VLPSLNERLGLEIIYPKIDKSLFYRIVVLDGNSSDGTKEWCKENYIEVFIQTKKGLRSALTEFLSTLSEDIDFILTFSPDGNCDPDTLSKFMQILNNSKDIDLIIGSRYAENFSSQDDGLITGLGNKFFTGLCNFLFRSHFTDVFSIYRAFNPKIVKTLSLDDPDSYEFLEKLLSTNIPWEALMSFRIAKYQRSWIDVGVGEPRRITGERKLQVVRWGIAFFAQLIREIWYKPKSLKL